MLLQIRLLYLRHDAWLAGSSLNKKSLIPCVDFAKLLSLTTIHNIGFLRIFTFPKKEPVRRLWYMKANEDHGCQSRTFDDLRRSNSPDGEHLVVKETRAQLYNQKSSLGTRAWWIELCHQKLKGLDDSSYARSDGWTILSNILHVRQLLMALTIYQGWFFYFMMWHSFILPQGPWCLC